MHRPTCRTLIDVSLELRLLSAQLPDSDELPTEFKLFAYGRNDTSKGPVTFDRESARLVMAAYAKHGVDVMIDLEHLSLDSRHPNYDPDARGACRLELRDDGLWAVAVRWNTDGAERIRERKQRYISPASFVTKSGRVVELVNIALCGMPATDNARPLIAASRRLETQNMNVEDVKKAIAAMRADDGDAALSILENIVAEAAAAGASGGGEAPPADPAPASADPAGEPADEPKPEEELAAASQLITLTGAGGLPAALELVRTWKASHDGLEAERVALRIDRAKLEGEQRDALVTELVVLGSETPATAWADPTVATDKSKRKPSQFLALMPLSALADRVARMKADPRVSDEVRPPAGSTIVGLTAEQEAICKRTGCDPKVFLAQLNRTLNGVS